MGGPKVHLFQLIPIPGHIWARVGPALPPQRPLKREFCRNFVTPGRATGSQEDVIRSQTRDSYPRRPN